MAQPTSGSRFDAELMNSKKADVDISGSTTGRFAAKAVKLVGCSDDGLTDAIQKMGDNWQEQFKTLFTGVSSEDEQGAALQKKIEGQLHWYQNTMSLAREKAREKSRIDLKMLTDDATLEEEDVKVRTAVLAKAMAVERSRMESQAAAFRSDLDLQQSRRDLDGERTARQRQVKLQQQFDNIVNKQGELMDSIIDKASTTVDQQKLEEQMKHIMMASADTTGKRLQACVQQKQFEAMAALQDEELKMKRAEHQVAMRKQIAQMDIEDNRDQLERLSKKHQLEKELADKSHEDDKVRAQRKVDTMVSAEDRVADAENLQELVKGLKTYDEARREAWQRVTELLRCTEHDLNLDRSNACMMRLARLSFLLVILGCELDMWGYAMAFFTYWQPELMLQNEDQCIHHPSTCDSCLISGCPFATLSLMHCLLLIGPCGYLTALIYYTYDSLCGVEEESDSGMHARPTSDGKEPLLQIIDDPEAGPHGYTELPTIAVKESCDIRPYHIIPVLRNYLLIKEMVPDDVEALFRVNSLSTFTLGFAQIACMVLGVAKGWLPWPPTVVLVIGITAQVVNISMTFVYFGTAVPVMMQTANTIDAMIAREREQLQRDLVRYNEAAKDAALKYKPSDPQSRTRPATLQLFHNKVEREIKEAVGLFDLDLEHFTMEEKMGIAFYQRSKKINQFVSMCKLGTPFQKQTA